MKKFPEKQWLGKVFIAADEAKFPAMALAVYVTKDETSYILEGSYKEPAVAQGHADELAAILKSNDVKLPRDTKRYEAQPLSSLPRGHFVTAAEMTQSQEAEKQKTQELINAAKSGDIETLAKLAGFPPRKS